MVRLLFNQILPSLGRQCGRQTIYGLKGIDQFLIYQSLVEIDLILRSSLVDDPMKNIYIILFDQVFSLLPCRWRIRASSKTW